ncbi:MAG: nicotinate-nucleotide adenylyltransferase [Mobilitalea sp.]
MKKVGIMGGTFNPVHLGHLFLAERTYEQMELDQVLFIPSKNPPHKQKPQDVTDQQRVEMLLLAIEDNPHFAVSEMELDRDGTTYTADTLSILTRDNPDTQYYFIVGADSLFSLSEWWSPEVIFEKCVVAAACRDQVNKEGLEQQAEFLRVTYNAKIELIDMPTLMISSSEVKDNVSRGKSIKYYVPTTVEDYIKKNKLYLFPMEA